MFKAIGNALYLGRQYDEASIAFDLAVRYDANSSPNETRLGAAYAAMGKNELAEAHLERALSIDPLNLDAAEALISVYEKSGDGAKADALKSRIASILH